MFFFFNDTATTEIYTLSLHDALPIFPAEGIRQRKTLAKNGPVFRPQIRYVPSDSASGLADRKSTRLNSSHSSISYAVFCLKKKNKITNTEYQSQINT